MYDIFVYDEEISSFVPADVDGYPFRITGKTRASFEGFYEAAEKTAEFRFRTGMMYSVEFRTIRRKRR